MKIWGIVTALILIILTGLVYTANEGNISSTIILTVLITEVLNLIGVGIVLLVLWLTDKRQQRDFRENTKENLAIMSAMQSLQNKQNQGLIQQINSTHRMPVNGVMPLMIEDGIFDELED